MPTGQPHYTTIATIRDILVESGKLGERSDIGWPNQARAQHNGAGMGGGGLLASARQTKAVYFLLHPWITAQAKGGGGVVRPYSHWRATHKLTLIKVLVPGGSSSERENGHKGLSVGGTIARDFLFHRNLELTSSCLRCCAPFQRRGRQSGGTNKRAWW